MLISPHTPKLCNMGHPQENSQELDKKYLMSKTKLPPGSFMIKRHKSLPLCEKHPYSVIKYSCSDQNTMLAVKDNNTRHLCNFSFEAEGATKLQQKSIEPQSAPLQRAPSQSLRPHSEPHGSVSPSRRQSS